MQHSSPAAAPLRPRPRGAKEAAVLSTILLLTNTSASSPEVLPALALLPHTVRVLPLEVTAMLGAAPADALLVDARRELISARGLTRLLHTTGCGSPVIAVVTEGGLAAVSVDWQVDDFLLDTAGPGEVEARLRVVLGRADAPASDPGADDDRTIRSGELLIDEDTYSVKLHGRTLDLTYKEFELLKYLAQHGGRVFTRAQLLQEVWGYDYYGGTRTVDVHVRRLRAKLGVEHEGMIGTVRNVGYKFVDPPPRADSEFDSPPVRVGSGSDRPPAASSTAPHRH